MKIKDGDVRHKRLAVPSLMTCQCIRLLLEPGYDPQSMLPHHMVQ